MNASDSQLDMDWDQARLEEYIDNEVEEGPELDYKARDALAKTDSKRTEITKDVSAMANASGGIIIYGIKEYPETIREHLPQSIQPISRSEFPKEWLEHVINAIRPRIPGVQIYSIPISSDPDHHALAVEIPMSTTAHQAKDYRYYRRFNFESVPMLDYEIRDVMNRSVLPKLQVVISRTDASIKSHLHQYILGVEINNIGSRKVDDFKLVIKFPDYGDFIGWRKLSNYNHPYFGLISHEGPHQGHHIYSFKSRYKLFPEDEIDIGKQLQITYKIDDEAYSRIGSLSADNPLTLKWRLYADEMLPISDEVLFSNLHIY